MDAPSDRRRFLKSVIALGAVGLPVADVAAEPHAHAAPVAQLAADRPPATHPRAYMFLMPPEVAFVEAAVARLIPADELGPGAKEAGVAFFIDQQLGGAWGTMARNYRLGPWPEGTPQQGYQSPLTPQEVYRAAIRDTNLYCDKQYGKTFDALTPAQQDEVLRGLEDDKIALQATSARLFFTLLLNNTQEGFFADPVYGGNRDKDRVEAGRLSRRGRRVHRVHREIQRALPGGTGEHRRSPAESGPGRRARTSQARAAQPDRVRRRP